MNAREKETDLVDRLRYASGLTFVHVIEARNLFKEAAHALETARSEERKRTIEEIAKDVDEFTREANARDAIVGRIIAHNIRSLPTSE